MNVKIGGPFVVTDAMRANIDKVMATGRLSPGPFVSEFEEKFAKYHGYGHAIMTNSGTSALVVALQAMKEGNRWPDGAEVICPAVTFVATINAVLHCNLKPVLVDVDPTYYTIDPELLAGAITPATKAIMPVHVFGLPAAMANVMRCAAHYDLEVIEDACEALGAAYNGEKVGAIGDIGCFSFYMSHHITAGVGGMAITDSPIYAHKMRSLVNHGWDRDKAPMDATEFDFEAIQTRYHFKTIGHSYRATEIEAAIALPQLDDLDQNIIARANNAKRLTAALGQYSDRLQLPKGAYNRLHALMMYPIILREGDKWALIKHLEQAGIDTREMLPLTNQPCYKGLFNEDDYPVAQWINEQGFYVGCSQYLKPEQMYFVAEKIGEFLG